MGNISCLNHKRDSTQNCQNLQFSSLLSSHYPVLLIAAHSCNRMSFSCPSRLSTSPPNLKLNEIKHTLVRTSSLFILVPASEFHLSVLSSWQAAEYSFWSTLSPLTHYVNSSLWLLNCFILRILTLELGNNIQRSFFSCDIMGPVVCVYHLVQDSLSWLSPSFCDFLNTMFS